MKLIVGLGNPGQEYARHRHNVGFQCLNLLSKACLISIKQSQSKARVGMGQMAGQPLLLAQPQTYMNRSGEAVRLLAARHHLPPPDIIVLHDDLDLPLGRIRIRPGGGSGGHKGVASIIAALGSQDFIRVRVGISRPPEEMATEDYVLSPFAPEEEAVMGEVRERVVQALLCLLDEGLEAAMNRYNT
ncbi:MAG: aminoacyl-tRNA hydrolase [Chloroflexi bacterium]|nr:aminoacyl-tRNA hydrolase [Chloroflexota bacterium]